MYTRPATVYTGYIVYIHRRRWLPACCGSCSVDCTLLSVYTGRPSGIFLPPTSALLHDCQTASALTFPGQRRCVVLFVLVFQINVLDGGSAPGARIVVKCLTAGLEGRTTGGRPSGRAARIGGPFDVIKRPGIASRSKSCPGNYKSVIATADRRPTLLRP